MLFDINATAFGHVLELVMKVRKKRAVAGRLQILECLQEALEEYKRDNPMGGADIDLTPDRKRGVLTADLIIDRQSSLLL